MELSSFIRFNNFNRRNSSNFYNNLVIRNKNYCRLGKGVSRTREFGLVVMVCYHQTMVTLLLTLRFVTEGNRSTFEKMSPMFKSGNNS